MRVYLVVVIFACILLNADEVEVLSDTKKQILDLEKKQIEQKAISNQFDYIGEFNLQGNYTTNKDDLNTRDYSISFSQDIFKFGGISSQIQYAKELKKLELMNLTITRKDDLNSLYESLINIKLNDIALKQNMLNLRNSEIEIRNKKSQYKAGDLDISDLNNAIMTKNQLSDKKKELELAKMININEIKKFTDKDYETILLPQLEMISKDIFLKNSTNINYAQVNISVNENLYKMKKSDYLPTIGLNGTYGYNDTNRNIGNDYYNYGMSISMPLSYTASSNMEQKKLDFLISKQKLREAIIENTLLYDSTFITISNYNDRIKLAQEDISLYNELLIMNQEEYKAGYKTMDDVETLQNSQDIRALDIVSYKLNIQKEILTIYFQML
ncbi:MAG: TolC family protein [Arcobacteraceae bacterium]|nr:TolC family protein [Arcobacteraceae bacterium]